MFLKLTCNGTREEAEGMCVIDPLDVKAFLPEKHTHTLIVVYLGDLDSRKDTVRVDRAY